MTEKAKWFTRAGLSSHLRWRQKPGRSSHKPSFNRYVHTQSSFLKSNWLLLEEQFVIIIFFLYFLKLHVHSWKNLLTSLHLRERVTLQNMYTDRCIHSVLKQQVIILCNCFLANCSFCLKSDLPIIEDKSWMIMNVKELIYGWRWEKALYCLYMV